MVWAKTFIYLELNVTLCLRGSWCFVSLAFRGTNYLFLVSYRQNVMFFFRIAEAKLYVPLWAMASCEILGLKCFLHAVTLETFACKNVGTEFHSLIAKIVLRFKTNFHWQNVTLLSGLFALTFFSTQILTSQLNTWLLCNSIYISEKRVLYFSAIVINLLNVELIFPEHTHSLRRK